ESHHRGLLHRDRVANRDLAALDHFGIDAALVMAKAAHQHVGNLHVARGKLGIDIDGRAAGDALDYPEPCAADRKRLAEEACLKPSRPAADIDGGAEAEWMDGQANHVLDRSYARKIDDRNHFAGDVGKAVAGAGEHLGRALDLGRMAPGEEAL